MTGEGVPVTLMKFFIHPEDRKDEHYIAALSREHGPVLPLDEVRALFQWAPTRTEVFSSRNWEHAVWWIKLDHDPLYNDEEEHWTNVVGAAVCHKEFFHQPDHGHVLHSDSYEVPDDRLYIGNNEPRQIGNAVVLMGLFRVYSS